MNPLARVIRFAFALALVAGMGCAPAQPGGDARVATSAPGGDTVTTRPEASLLELDFPLVDRDGRTRHLAEFAGQPLVVSMVYTSCKSVCPRITADLKSLDRELPADLKARTRFLLFSLDPARDTPAALAAFAREHQLDDRWTLLAASEDDMRTLAAVLGVRFRPDPDGEIAHSAVIGVTDDHGVLRHRQAGVGQDAATLVAALRSATEDGAGTRHARR